MSQAGLFPSSYDSRTLPCPAWTGTGGLTYQYESAAGAVPVMRGGSKPRNRRSYNKRSKRRNNKRKGIYGGFIPRSHNIRSNPTKQTRRVDPKKTPTKYSVPNVSRSGSQKNR